MSLGRGQVFAGYTIVRLLGSGGMGEVYLAEHPRLPRDDALKVLPADVSADPEFRSRFNREADLAAGLFHPHIVGVHDRGEFEGQLWIAMDYVEGTDAASLMHNRYPAGIPQARGTQVRTAVASALDKPTYARKSHEPPTIFYGVAAAASKPRKERGRGDTGLVRASGGPAQFPLATLYRNSTKPPTDWPDTRVHTVDEIGAQL
jgi:hypothetical protein